MKTKFSFTLLFLAFGYFAMAQETFFPPSYKEFQYKEGDLLGSQVRDGWIIVKILKIDEVHLKKGESINIQNQLFTTPVDDFLLVIGISFSKTYPSLEELKIKVEQKSWSIQVGHVPRRTTGVGEGRIFLGNEPVTEEELSGYFAWKNAFDKGEAGIF